MRKFLKTLRNQKKPLIIFTDFDGCLTDDRVWLNAAGEEFVAANRKDGLAIQRLNKIGIKDNIASNENLTNYFHKKLFNSIIKLNK